MNPIGLTLLPVLVLFLVLSSTSRKRGQARHAKLFAGMAMAVACLALVSTAMAAYFTGKEHGRAPRAAARAQQGGAPSTAR